ncbi:MAG: hypothetical protein AAF551_10440, partial [Bacteroidota bacterium]
MMKQLFTLLTLSILLVISCDSIKKKTKETINKSGEAVGKTASEFIEGVSEGIEETLKCEVSLSQALQDQGLKTGKFTVDNDTTGGKENQLTLYLIFENDFKKTLTAKAFDKNELEIGRTRL